MTVAKLIEKLQALPPDLLVYTSDAEWGEEEATEVDVEEFTQYAPWGTYPKDQPRPSVKHKGVMIR